MKEKNETEIIDNNTLHFHCVDEGGGYLDTRVTINGTLFCWISYPEKAKFLEDFSEFMSKHL